MQEDNKRIRGRILLGYVNYIRKKWGRVGLDAAERGLNMKLADISANKWYPYSQAEGVVAWIARNYSPLAVRNAGAHLVSESGVIMAYAKAGDLDGVLKSISEARENSNFGSLEISKEPWGVKVAVKEFCTTEEMCESWHGTLEGVIRMLNVPGRVDRVAGGDMGTGACTFNMVFGK